MILAKASTSKAFVIVPAGVHQAVCFGTWDIGLHKTVHKEKDEKTGQYKEKEKIQPKVVIGWEIDETIQEGEYKGKRYCIFKKYTLSAHENASLRKDLTSWRNKEFLPGEMENFDIEKLVGANCQLNIIHNKVGDKVYANVSTIMKLAKGMQSINPENNPDIPGWVKELQDKQIQPEAIHNVDDVPSVQIDNNEDVPF